LTSTTNDGGSGIASVVYQSSPAGAGTWTTTPAAWDTTALADGLYDLSVRGTVSLTGTAADGGAGVASFAFQRSPAGAGSWTTIGTDGSSPYSTSFDTTGVADGLY